MAYRPLRSAKLRPRRPASAVSVLDLEDYADQWMSDGILAGWTRATLDNRRIFTKNLIWYLNDADKEFCGEEEMRDFFKYLRQNNPNGKWGLYYPDGRPRITRAASNSTLRTYRNHLTTFFRWVIDYDLIEQSPLEALPVPLKRKRQICPLVREQGEKLIRVARRSKYGRRNGAIVLLLLDTGLRASECVDLNQKDVDIDHNRIHIRHGKGDKSRTLHFGRKTKHALWSYMRWRQSMDRDDMRDDDPFFVSEGGNTPGCRLTRDGLGDIIEQLGIVADLRGVRCSPHTLRHTFAVTFLMNGGNSFALQYALGHDDMEATQIYVNFTNANLEELQTKYSVVDGLKV